MIRVASQLEAAQPGQITGGLAALECGEALSGAFGLVVEFAVAALGGSDLDRFAGVHTAVGLSDGELAIGCEFQAPAEFVHEMVVSAAQWQQIR